MSQVTKKYNFDCDDNLLSLPTKIFYFNKVKDSPITEIPISTEMFAVTRNKVGVEDYFLHYSEVDGELVEASDSEFTISVNVKNFEVLYDKDESKLTVEEKESYDINRTSFREFRDCSKNDYFLRDLKKAIKHNTFAPSWKDFVEACSEKETAENTTIITARGQSPETLHRGMKYLQEQGLIKYCPPVKNMFPVSYKGLPEEFVGQADNPSDAKRNIFATLLDQIELSSRSGGNYSIGFSDDDKKTFDVMYNFLKKEVENGRWSNFEINLYFTGNKKKERFVLLEKNEVA